MNQQLIISRTEQRAPSWLPSYQRGLDAEENPLAESSGEDFPLDIPFHSTVEQVAEKSILLVNRQKSWPVSY